MFSFNKKRIKEKKYITKDPFTVEQKRRTYVLIKISSIQFIKITLLWLLGFKENIKED